MARPRGTSRNTADQADKWFWPKVDRSGECWLWTGCISTKTGCGQVRAFGERLSAHYVAWILAGRPAPEGDAFVRHTCGTGHCVRVDHLELYVPPIPARPLRKGEGNPLGLTADEIREYLAIDCCPICGEGPWRAVAQHIRFIHGYKADEVKRWAGLNRTTSLISIEYREEKRETMVAAGAEPWLHGAPPTGKRWVNRSQALEAHAAADGTEGALVEMANVEHGTFLAYQKGCRCARCRMANSDRNYRVRQARRDRLAEREGKHGTIGTYSNWGCRCDLCTATWREHMKTRVRRKHVSEMLGRSS